MRRSRPARCFAVLLALVAALGLAAPVAAHPGGEPFIHVPLDHLVPGEPFPVVAADLGPGSVVTFSLGPQVLGQATAGPDGHFEATLMLPASTPLGYTQLTATSDDGSTAATWVNVATGGSVNVPPPVVVFDWVDPSLVGLVALVAVIAAIIAIRRRQSGRGAPPPPEDAGPALP